MIDHQIKKNKEFNSYIIEHFDSRTLVESEHDRAEQILQNILKEVPDDNIISFNGFNFDVGNYSEKIDLIDQLLLKPTDFDLERIRTYTEERKKFWDKFKDDMNTIFSNFRNSSKLNGFKQYFFWGIYFAFDMYSFYHSIEEVVLIPGRFAVETLTDTSLITKSNIEALDIFNQTNFGDFIVSKATNAAQIKESEEFKRMTTLPGSAYVTLMDNFSLIIKTILRVKGENAVAFITEFKSSSQPWNLVFLNPITNKTEPVFTTTMNSAPLETLKTTKEIYIEIDETKINKLNKTTPLYASIFRYIMTEPIIKEKSSSANTQYFKDVVLDTSDTTNLISMANLNFFHFASNPRIFTLDQRYINPKMDDDITNQLLTYNMNLLDKFLPRTRSELDVFQYYFLATNYRSQDATSASLNRIKNIAEDSYKMMMYQLRELTSTVKEPVDNIFKTADESFNPLVILMGLNKLGIFAASPLFQSFFTSAFFLSTFGRNLKDLRILVPYLVAAGSSWIFAPYLISLVTGILVFFFAMVKFFLIDVLAKRGFDYFKIPENKSTSIFKNLEKYEFPSVKVYQVIRLLSSMINYMGGGITFRAIFGLTSVDDPLKLLLCDFTAASINFIFASVSIKKILYQKELFYDNGTTAFIIMNKYYDTKAKELLDERSLDLLFYRNKNSLLEQQGTKEKTFKDEKTNNDYVHVDEPGKFASVNVIKFNRLGRLPVTTMADPD